MKFTVTYEIEGQESVTVSTKPIDIVKWEKANRRKIGDGMGFTDMAVIAHGAAKREGLTELSFDEWMTQLDDFEIIPSDPTLLQQVPSNGSSGD